MRRGLRIAAALCLAGLLSGMTTSPDPPLTEAAMNGDVEAVRSLVRDGVADVNVSGGDGMTALHWAAQRGDAAMAEILLEGGAEVGLVTRLGDYTPLHLAARNAHAELVVMLLEAGSDPNATTSSGATALHLAARGGDSVAVRALLEHGADVEAREAYWKQTPLVFATSFNRLQALKVLLEHGADVSVTTKVVDVPERSEVDRAAQQRRDEILEEFRREASVGASESWRPTAEELQFAVREARKVQERLMREIEERGPGDRNDEGEDGYSTSWTDLVGTHGGLTPLLHAVREGNTDAARMLLESGADVNQVSAGDGTSPLLMATINGHFDLALELLEAGADPNLANRAGATPLFATINIQWAPRSRYPQQHAHMVQDATYLKTMEALLEAGADPNARLQQHLWFMSYNFDVLNVDTRGATPFWRAAYGTDVEAMKLLVKHGADPEIPTQAPPSRRRGYGGGDDGDPSGVPPVSEGGAAVYPIHAATGVGYGEGYAANAHRHVPEGWLPAVRYLVEELGADVNARDHNAFTPLHHAAARGDVEVIEYLVQQGADVSVLNRSGVSVADMANGPVQRVPPFPRARDLLLELGSPFADRCLSC